MSALRALGLHADSFPTFSHLDVRRKLGKLKIHSDIDLEFVTENLEKALEANDKVLATALHKVRKNYQMRNLLRDFDEIVLGRTLGRISKSVRGTKQES
jgi:hypothetical protein